jgi:tetratricopeptide (TPR) repeat protein
MNEVVSTQIEEAKKYLRAGKGRSAISAVTDGLELYPQNPLLLSFYGYLLCSVEKSFKEGIKKCREAIKVLTKSQSPDGKELLPSLYLNLGRAYLSSNDKVAAVAAFREGLQRNPGNSDLVWEMKKLGTRKNPPIPFLKRSNPLNIYLGKLRSKLARR